MESDKYICIRETGAQNQVVIVDMATPLAPQRRQITADSALMCPDKKVIALKATTPGTPGDALQVFNLDTKTKLKSHQMPESVEFWKWITPNMLGLVTATSVYHWDIQVCPAALGSTPAWQHSAGQQTAHSRAAQNWHAAQQQQHHCRTQAQGSRHPLVTARVACSGHLAAHGMRSTLVASSGVAAACSHSQAVGAARSRQQTGSPHCCHSGISRH